MSTRTKARTETRAPAGDECAPARRVGRPRAAGADRSEDPAEDILRAAAGLFATRGFGGTSTAQIAAAVGLRQSAIFHWFPSKDAILEALFSRGWDRSLAYFAQVDALTLPAAVKLCMCLSYDAAFVAGAEPYLKLMIVPPELHQPRFGRLLAKRRHLIACLERFIAQAIEQGDFRPVDPPRAANMVLAVDEVVLDAAASGDAPTPEQHAALAVDFVLHALAVDRRRIATIRASLARQRATRISPPPA
jgi:AcrR family transcriptional regulator